MAFEYSSSVPTVEVIDKYTNIFKKSFLGYTLFKQLLNSISQKQFFSEQIGN